MKTSSLRELLEILFLVQPVDDGETWFAYIMRAKADNVISTEDRYRLQRFAVGLEVLTKPVDTTIADRI